MCNETFSHRPFSNNCIIAYYNTLYQSYYKQFREFTPFQRCCCPMYCSNPRYSLFIEVLNANWHAWNVVNSLNILEILANFESFLMDFWLEFCRHSKDCMSTVAKIAIVATLSRQGVDNSSSNHSFQIEGKCAYWHTKIWRQFWK